MNDLSNSTIELLYTIGNAIKTEDTDKIEKLIDINEDWPQPEREKETIENLLISIHQLLEKTIELKDEAEESRNTVTQIADFIENLT